ncbi:MAG: hypothetical protein EXR72_11210 [Myxococcales bacterium]|nr:hypothetical protein [Myxococcales bacterium]
MWIILGNKVQTTRVQGGRKIERPCAACGETAMFYEREVTSSFRVYFINLFNYETHRAMACGACGELYATDELGQPASGESIEDRQKGTVLGTVKEALKRAGNALQDATGVKPDADVGAQGDREFEAPRKTLQPPALRLPAHEDGVEEPYADPLASDDDDLNARFAALEKKLGKNRSSQKPVK